MNFCQSTETKNDFDKINTIQTFFVQKLRKQTSLQKSRKQKSLNISFASFAFEQSSQKALKEKF